MISLGQRGGKIDGAALLSIPLPRRVEHGFGGEDIV